MIPQAVESGRAIVYMYMYMSICMYVYTCEHISVCKCKHICIYICVYMYSCLMATVNPKWVLVRTCQCQRENGGGMEKREK